MLSDPMLDLLPAGTATMPLLQELGAALIAYTPPNFKAIHCEISEGSERGQRDSILQNQLPTVSR